MSHDRLADYLDHMTQAAQQACDYIEGMHKQAFLADRRTQQAVILNLVVIGEAATRLLQVHSAFLDNHPQVPWRSMKGMRNRIAYGYFDIDLDLVWETVRTALPELPTQLATIQVEVQTGCTRNAGD